MAKVLAFDIEANGLLLDATRIWCMTVQDVKTEQIWSFTEDNLNEGLDLLCTADMITAHNGVGYDCATIRRLYKRELPKCLDTLLVSRLVYPDKFNHPLGDNSLEAWGRFLGFPKTDYKGGFESFSPEMLEYNINDVKLQTKIYNHQASRFFKRFGQAIKLEHQVARIITKQIENGFTLDIPKAQAFRELLVSETAKAAAKIDEIYPPKTEVKVSNDGWEGKGYKFKNLKEVKAFGLKRSDVTQVTRTETIVHKLNCASGVQILEAMKELYGWVPKVFSEKGNPKLDNKVLSSVDNPLARAIIDHRLLIKRVEFVESWLQAVRSDGRVHGSVITNGAPSGRMAHNDPNMAQVPKVKKDKNKKPIMGALGGFGFESRSCWKPRDGWVLVGADASGLELRMLGHELAQWDGGTYANAVVHGVTNADGSHDDIHVVNQKAAKLPTREAAKTFIYGLVYGAGDPKLGAIVGGSADRGRKLRSGFERAVPAYALLKNRVRQDHKASKTLYGIDGRPLPIRSEHAALNTLLQSHGAVVMKLALVLFDEAASAYKDWAYCANVHDEIQIECDSSIAHALGKLLVESIRRAGEILRMRCRLDGEYHVGRNWAETH